MIKELIIDGSSKDFTFKKVNLGDAREFFIVVPLSDDPSIKPIPIAGYEVIVFNDRTINLSQTALGEMKPESSSQSFIDRAPLDLWDNLENLSDASDEEGAPESSPSHHVPRSENNQSTPAHDVPENLGAIRNVKIHPEDHHPESRREKESPQSNKPSSPSRAPGKEKNEGTHHDAQDTNVASALRSQSSSSNTGNNNGSTNGNGNTDSVTPTPEPPAPIYNYAAQTFYGSPSFSSLIGDAGDDTFYTFSNLS